MARALLSRQLLIEFTNLLRNLIEEFQKRLGPLAFDFPEIIFELIKILRNILQAIFELLDVLVDFHLLLITFNHHLDVVIELIFLLFEALELLSEMRTQLLQILQALQLIMSFNNINCINQICLNAQNQMVKVVALVLALCNIFVHSHFG